MTSLQEDLRHLIESSEALKDSPEEQWYWLSTLGELNETGLERLKGILGKEAQSVKEIREEEASHLATIDADHLKAIENLKHVELPRFLKKWEASSSAKENPENILESL